MQADIKRARQWEDQLELFTGFPRHVNFPLNGGNWNASRRPYGSLWAGTTRQSDGDLLNVNHWCLRHFHTASWRFFALWPSIVHVGVINHCAMCLARVYPFFFVRIMLHQSNDLELMRRENLKNCSPQLSECIVNRASSQPVQRQSYASLFFRVCDFLGSLRIGGEKKNSATWQLVYKPSAEG